MLCRESETEVSWYYVSPVNVLNASSYCIFKADLCPCLNSAYVMALNTRLAFDCFNKPRHLPAPSAGRSPNDINVIKAELRARKIQKHAPCLDFGLFVKHAANETENRKDVCVCVCLCLCEEKRKKWKAHKFSL